MNKKNIIYLLSLIFAFSVIGCGDMSETYSEFVKDGETIYIGKPDSIKVRSGKERVEISWLLLSDPKISKYKISWNNGENFLESDLVRSDRVDTVRVIIENLPEYIYDFDIVHYDDQGNSSVKSTAIGRTYGALYQSTLINRSIRSMLRVNDSKDLMIEWYAASDEVLNVELNYIDALGSPIVRELAPGNLLDTLLNFPVNGVFEYQTRYLPQPDALDQFIVPAAEVSTVGVEDDE